MAHSGDQKRGVSPEFLGDVALVAAQQKAMEGEYKFLPHGGKLFVVEQGWESGVISRDPGVARADTLLTLESALQNPDSRVIFIPQGALMTDEDIVKLCQRNGITKTIFKEVKKS